MANGSSLIVAFVHKKHAKLLNQIYLLEKEIFYHKELLDIWMCDVMYELTLGFSLPELNQFMIKYIIGLFKISNVDEITQTHLWAIKQKLLDKSFAVQFRSINSQVWIKIWF